MIRLLSKFVICTAILFLAQVSHGQVVEARTPVDGLFERRLLQDKRPIPLPYIREADVLWKKRVWQIIDLRETINHPLYFPTTVLDDRQSLMQVLMNAINEGQIRAFQDDEFTQPLTPEQIRTMYARVETRRLIRPRPPHEEFDTTIVIPLTTDEVIRFRVKEDWFFDSKRSMLDVRIIGLAPVRERFDPVTGESLGDQTLFWVWFEEARNVLANAEVFNRHNDAKRISFDDLFMRRMFNSFIYKESNVFNRRIEEYLTNGLDQLLEAERIRNEIRHFEHDVWEY